MKAIRIHKYGGPDVLQYEDAPMPEIAPGDVLIKVTASSVNPVDWKIRSGNAKDRWPIPFPYILGWDVSGIVAQTGTMVANFQVGDKVYARGNSARNGAYAEYIAVRASEVAYAPKNIALSDAAGIPLACMTAWAALFEQGDLRAGQTILIHGASGGVGTFAVQLAKDTGAHVIATASAANVEMVKSIGADEVIDYKSQDFTKEARDLDFVFDTIGGDTQKKSWGLIKKGGILVSTVGADESAAQQYGVRAKRFMIDSNGGRLSAITALVDAGKIKVIIEKEFPLTEIREAHQLSEKGHSRGKIIIRVS